MDWTICGGDLCNENCTVWVVTVLIVGGTLVKLGMELYDSTFERMICQISLQEGEPELNSSENLRSFEQFQFKFVRNDCKTSIGHLVSKIQFYSGDLPFKYLETLANYSDQLIRHKSPKFIASKMPECMKPMPVTSFHNALNTIDLSQPVDA